MGVALSQGTTDYILVVIQNWISISGQLPVFSHNYWMEEG